jgi:hypothetical protein
MEKLYVWLSFYFCYVMYSPFSILRSLNTPDPTWHLKCGWKWNNRDLYIFYENLTLFEPEEILQLIGFYIIVMRLCIPFPFFALSKLLEYLCIYYNIDMDILVYYCKYRDILIETNMCTAHNSYYQSQNNVARQWTLLSRRNLLFLNHVLHVAA